MARALFVSFARVSAGVCLVTGVFLAAAYAPTWAAAQPAVRAMQNDVSLGGVLRGLHHWGGALAIAFVALDLAVQFARGGYRQRQPWVRTVALFAVVVAFGYTGYLLVGDERAYTGVVVLEGALRSAPWIGDGLADAVLGGPVASSATLARLYVLHAVCLPALLLWLATRSRREVPFLPLPSCGLLAALAALAYLLPPAVGEAGAPGMPPAADARPEWFFLWVNELLHRVDGMSFLIAVVLPLALLGVLFALPWIASASTRKFELSVAGFVLTAILVLSVLAANREVVAEEPEEDGEPAPVEFTPEMEERLGKTLRRYRCVTCHRIAGDPDGGEEGPPLPRGEEFAELYTRRFFREKVADPKAFWADTGMNYPKNRKPTAEELALLERYFYGN